MRVSLKFALADECVRRYTGKLSVGLLHQHIIVGLLTYRPIMIVLMNPDKFLLLLS